MRSAWRAIRKLGRRLASRAGESLVEVLAAILVSSLGLLMLSMAVATSADLVQKSDKIADGYYAASEALATANADAHDTATTDDGTVTIMVGEEVVKTLNITYVADDLPGGIAGVVYEQKAEG